MINKIYCFNLENETIFKKNYNSKIEDDKIRNKVLNNIESNIIELKKSTIVYKKYDSLYVCFEVQSENEIYILVVIDFLMNLFERLLGSLNEKSFIYNFKDVNYLIDNYILNGKIINLDPLEISTSTYIIE